MRQTVELPALDGRDILGFLAALGLLRLLNDNAGIPARLSFDETTATALLHSPLASTQDITDTTVEVISTIAHDGVLPGLPARFPTAKQGSEPDPMRMRRDQFRSVAHTILDNQPEPVRQWFAALVTDLAVDAKDRVALTPYTAPAGQQSLRSFFTKPLAEIRKDPAARIREALTGWRRVDGYTGEYLDHRVLRSAADHPSGQSVEAGVPGATWLAIMALPLLRLTGTGSSVQAALWHTVPGRRQPVMIWPLWRQPLDPHAITALLEHPTLKPHTTTDGNIAVNRANWQPLGIFTVAGAARQLVEGRKSAGVLAPITVTSANPN